MIGVRVHPAEQNAARELFELCKAPWEFHRPGQRYDVLLTTIAPPSDEGLQVIFGGPVPAGAGRTNAGGGLIVWGEQRIPIYGALTTFAPDPAALLREETTADAVIREHREPSRRVVEVGYNLFTEVAHLLSAGQPAVHAAIPTLELHLALLRELIVRAGVPFVEIPPVPADHAFIACLTHDVDHPVLANHRWDHTMLGFLYRATAGSALRFLLGRLPARRLGRNWLAALRLPLVHLGLARDFWLDFDRYLEIEGDAPSTFFVIPARGVPGRTGTGAAPALRASRYDVEELLPVLRRIAAAGGEVALHGLDAWLDAEAGQRERERIARSLDLASVGVRMHWLYFAPGSPATLERAGFPYDSTVGYNETVGYRAGTTQVYRPLETDALRELPLHIMDTALFYPDYLNLDEAEARQRTERMLDDAVRFGGVITVNWHDRSIAPERLWDEFYRGLLAAMRRRRAWFATAATVVAWFNQRRAARISATREPSGALRIRAHLSVLDSNLPRPTIYVHKPHVVPENGVLAKGPNLGFVELAFAGNIDAIFTP